MPADFLCIHRNGFTANVFELIRQVGMAPAMYLGWNLVEETETMLLRGKRRVRVFQFIMMALQISALVSYAATAHYATLRRSAGKMGPQRRSPALEWHQVAQTATTPEDICRAVHHKVKYAAENADHWTGGKDTWNRGYGDCEDFAASVAELCADAGFTAQIRIYYPRTMRGLAHAVVVGQWNGELWMSSNGRFQWMTSEEELVRENARILSTSRHELVVMKLDRLPRDGGRILPSMVSLGESESLDLPQRLAGRSRNKHSASSKSLPTRDHYLQENYIDIIDTPVL